MIYNVSNIIEAIFGNGIVSVKHESSEGTQEITVLPSNRIEVKTDNGSIIVDDSNFKDIYNKSLFVRKEYTTDIEIQVTLNDSLKPAFFRFSNEAENDLEFIRDVTKHYKSAPHKVLIKPIILKSYTYYDIELEVYLNPENRFRSIAENPLMELLEENIVLKVVLASFIKLSDVSVLKEYKYYMHEAAENVLNALIGSNCNTTIKNVYIDESL